jgi:hypothetical protein
MFFVRSNGPFSPPFEAANQHLLSKKIKEGKFERIPIQYSEDLQKLISAMLNLSVNRVYFLTRML